MALTRVLGSVWNPEDNEYTSSATNGVTRTVQEKLDDFFNVKDFGAVGDGATDDSTSINNAIEAVNVAGGGRIHFPAGTYLCSSTVVPRARVICSAEFGTVILKLADTTNITLVESIKFDTFRATGVFQESDDPDMTLDYGFEGFIFDGNKANQTIRTPLVKMYGRRLTLFKCILTNSKGPGLWTALFGNFSGGFDFTKTKQPGDFGEIEFVQCEEEGWVFEGPSDQQIGQIVMNEIGDFANDGTTPQTSTLFPNQEVHGLRVEDAMNLYSANINTIRFGRGVYANARLTFGNIIIAGGWGNFWATSSAFGSIDSLLVQANPWDWNSIVNPSIEVDTDDLLFSAVTVRRVQGQDQSTAPGIQDNGGSQWGLVRNRQALAEGGILFLANAGSVNIASLEAGAADVALQTESACNRINVTCQFNNCNTVWVNNRSDIRGIWDFYGSLNAGQVFATGLDAAPNADEESLSNGRFEFLLDGVWKSNSFRGVQNFDSSTTNGQTVVFPHGMWRAPKVEEITYSARVSGWSSELGGLSLYTAGFNSTDVTARLKLETAAVGAAVSQAICRIN